MHLVYPRCAGLDVHKKTVVACVRLVGPDGSVQATTRTFGTMTAELLELADWLATMGVTDAAMESTGVYWKPVWHLLEGRFEMMLVNAGHIRQVPGLVPDRVAQPRPIFMGWGDYSDSHDCSFRHRHPGSIDS